MIDTYLHVESAMTISIFHGLIRIQERASIGVSRSLVVLVLVVHKKTGPVLTRIGW
jgi:hypothetical protein